MQIFKGEVCCYNVGIRVVGGMLHRSEIVYFVFLRDNDDAARVLSRSALYANAMRNKTLYFRLCGVYLVFIKIFAHIAVCRLARNGTYSTRAENVFRTEKLFSVFMYLALHFAREIQVDIRRFLAVKSEECLKRYIVPVALERRSATRAVFIGQVKTRTDGAVGEEFRILAMRAIVMRWQRIYLRDTSH